MDNITKNTISNLEIIVAIKLVDKEYCNQIYSNLLLETNFDPNERSTASIEKIDSTLFLKIDAKDSVSARATINSYLKWIDLSSQLIDYVKKEIK